ncbi:hypothetical protein ACFQ5N_14255 [Lutibacter holmesii]|uniref:Uncharacterized protein n=1 Tax=Lutibacter holmesii TaxID=1137985 RepID=A0ABW3WTS9_9FLAO
MNKIRIIGLVILIISAITQVTVENEMIDFISAIGMGLGMGLLVAGKLKD